MLVGRYLFTDTPPEVPQSHTDVQDLDRVFPHCFGQARAEQLGSR